MFWLRNRVTTGLQFLSLYLKNDKLKVMKNGSVVTRFLNQSNNPVVTRLIYENAINKVLYGYSFDFLSSTLKKSSNPIGIITEDFMVSTTRKGFAVNT